MGAFNFFEISFKFLKDIKDANIANVFTNATSNTTSNNEVANTQTDVGAQDTKDSKSPKQLASVPKSKFESSSKDFYFDSTEKIENPKFPTPQMV